MPVAPSDKLTVYSLNVGEGDTTVIRTPGGRVVVIDAVVPDKLVDLLTQIGLEPGEEIEHFVITHPHRDHFGGAASLLAKYQPHSMTLPPFWHKKGWGPKSYQTLINTIEQQAIPVSFLSGYSRVYLDDLVEMTDSGDPNVLVGEAAAGDPIAGGVVPCLEQLGPPNSLIANIAPKTGYGENHLSVMSRLTWGKFSMVIAADAQMENWAAFDREGMLADTCQVLRAAHHGSKNGTQWERLQRLAPGFVIVSSDPDGRYKIPDLCGCSAFKEYERYGNFIALTNSTGSIELSISANGQYTAAMFGDGAKEKIDMSKRTPLTRAVNPTDWAKLLNHRLE
ncbi:MAG: MBL fold metallo-hydrolase [Armatimonadetes bacterium]|nr:MBL fold metallo-hydrolase [Armatimonadota bacterium]